ncbi:hypothetical protein APSETT444_003754 [Aspergillus pseudonomiae]
MAKAQHEISQIISSLMIILWKHTDNLGIPHRPLGHDWTELQNHVSRLLTLRGMTQTGASIPEDPWNLILSEFGPTTALVLSASFNEFSWKSNKIYEIKVYRTAQ